MCPQAPILSPGDKCCFFFLLSPKHVQALTPLSFIPFRATPGDAHRLFLALCSGYHVTPEIKLGLQRVLPFKHAMPHPSIPSFIYLFIYNLYLFILHRRQHITSLSVSFTSLYIYIYIFQKLKRNITSRYLWKTAHPHWLQVAYFFWDIWEATPGSAQE